MTRSNKSMIVAFAVAGAALAMTPMRGLADQQCLWEGSGPECADEDPTNGYWSNLEHRWVPGYVTMESHMAPIWGVFSGRVVSYAPEVMEATAEVRGLSMEGYVDAISLMSCGNMGDSAWILNPGGAWEGPFIVADCARRGDLYPIVVFRQEVAEVSWATAQRWGGKIWDGLTVSVGASPYQISEWGWTSVDYPSWWAANQMEFDPCRSRCWIPSS